MQCRSIWEAPNFFFVATRDWTLDDFSCTLYSHCVLHWSAYAPPVVRRKKPITNDDRRSCTNGASTQLHAHARIPLPSGLRAGRALESCPPPKSVSNRINPLEPAADCRPEQWPSPRVSPTPPTALQSISPKSRTACRRTRYQPRPNLKAFSLFFSFAFLFQGSRGVPWQWSLVYQHRTASA